MTHPAIDVAQLTQWEQLKLLDQLWAHLGRDPDMFPLSEAQRRDLNERLDRLEEDGSIGLTWDEALAEIRSG